MKRIISRALILVTAITIAVVVSFMYGVGKARADGCTFYNRDYCVPGYISNESWFTPAPRHIVGKAVWYAPYLMERTAEVRGMDLEGFVGGVSLMSPADIGQTVWLQRPDTNVWEGPFLVVDCSARQDMWVTVTQIEEVVEVDFDTALRWGMVSGNRESYSVDLWMIRDVEVFKGLHPPWQNDEPVNYADWFEQTVTWGDGNYERWSMDDIEIANYDEYRRSLAVFLKIDFNKLIAIENKTEEIAMEISEISLFSDEIPQIPNEIPQIPYIPDETEEFLTVYQAHNYSQAYLDSVQTVDSVIWDVNCNDGNPYTGFWFYGTCVPGVISKNAWLMRYPQYSVGVSTYYMPGIMDTVIANRGMSLDGYVDGIVLMTCAHVGESVWVRRPGLGWEGPYLVVDCGQPDGQWNYAANRLHLEVDYDRWQLWSSTTGTQSIELCIGSRNCSGSPVSWSSYWLARVTWLIPD